MKVYINGKFVDQKNAKTSVFDSGMLYGDGVFETLFAIDGKIFWLEERVNRLLKGCKGLMIKIPWTKKQLISLTRQTLKKNNLKRAKGRLQITRGFDPRPNFLTSGKYPSLIISFLPYLKENPYYEKGMSLQSTNFQRIYPEVKNLNYLPSLIPYYRSMEKGYDDAFFVGDNNEVREGTSFNIFMVKGKNLFTPSKKIVNGITAKKVLGLAKSLHLNARYKEFSLKDLLAADESFATGTSMKIVPVVKINKKKIGNGRVGDTTRLLMKEFTKKYY